MKTINPDQQRLPAIFSGIPADTPVVMVNLLRFREIAHYKDGPASWSGREAYQKYSAFVLDKLKEIGADIMFVGDAKGSVIAPADELWDEVLLVRYPSIQTFIAMMASTDFREASKHRTAALEDSRLIATVQAASL